MQHITPEFLVLGIGWLTVFIVSITCHEAAHAWSAHRLGDPTAYHGGQVTLNPGPHLQREPVGMLIVPIISYVVFRFPLGWGSAPYDPYWGMRYRERALLMALAGPAANLILVVLAGVILRSSIEFGWAEHVQEGISALLNHELPQQGPARLMLLAWILFHMNLILMVFNLIPVPPLDGSAIWPLLLNSRQLEWYESIRVQPSFLMIGILVASSIFGKLYGPVSFWANSMIRGW